MKRQQISEEREAERRKKQLADYRTSGPTALGRERTPKNVVTEAQAVQIGDFWKAVWEEEGNYNPNHPALQNCGDDKGGRMQTETDWGGRERQDLGSCCAETAKLEGTRAGWHTRLLARSIPAVVEADRGLPLENGGRRRSVPKMVGTWPHGHDTKREGKFLPWKHPPHYLRECDIQGADQGPDGAPKEHADLAEALPKKKRKERMS